jgi:hypothetical protein
MKKILLFSLLLPLCVLIYSFNSLQSPSPQLINNIAVQFIVTNGYGNNVYVDNFILGTQFTNDVAIASINIPRDSNYSINGSTSFKVLPVISVANVGTASASGFNVVLSVGSYTSTKSVGTITGGGVLNVAFDSLAVNPSTPLNIMVYSTWASDQNRTNDTLNQYSIFFPGTKRKVTFEAFTATTCGPCASQNPSLDAFISARFDSIVPIKYHVWWPSAGDPMNLANPTQIQTRTSTYYAVSAVPTLIVDGIWVQVSGYTTLQNLLNPYNSRISKGSPLSINVVDSKITGDSIKTNITVNVISPLPSGNYKLRVESISRRITYATAPGSNGETDFKDVFRFAYPDINGTTVPTTPGTYNYEFRYKLSPLANATDTIYYTAAFVQNDATKEIINANKSRNYQLISDYTNPVSNNLISSKPVTLPTYVDNNNVTVTGSPTFNIDAGFNYETFESGGFPPIGWTIVNPNAGSLTWEEYSGISGPLLGGSKCTRVNCYSYSSTGHLDYLKSRIYNNVDLTDSLKFNWAHAVYSGYTERMQVQVSTNGGTSYPYTIFDKSGATLGTAPSSSSDFIPSDASQWGRFSIAMSSVITAINQIGTEIPSTYALNQNYPNPFNPVTSITYMIPKNTKVSLKVYDLKGQLIETLYDGNQNAGIYITQFDGSKLASGVYFYRLVSDNFSETKKMMMVK